MRQPKKIKLDPKNAREHNEENKALINKSLTELGAGRSILLDNENIVIAGNGVYEQAEALGIPVRVIESDGKELIAIKRTDLSFKDKKRKELSIVDNSATDKSSFKEEIFKDEHYEEVDWKEWGVNYYSHGGDVARVNDSDDWVGMPNFEAIDNPFKIIINFETAELREEYAKKNKMNFIKRSITAWSTWHPFRKQRDLVSAQYE